MGLVSLAARADHIIGGEMYYTYTGKNGTNNKYTITLKLFIRCDATSAQIDQSVNISIYNGNGGLAKNLVNIPLGDLQRYSVNEVDPCIINPPNVCYQIGYYTGTVELAPNASGYVATFERCCRRIGLANIFSDNNNVGGTYSCNIPGNHNGFDTNSSPSFTKERGVIVCANNRFKYDFAAEDPNGDSLVYSFSTAFTGADRDNPKPDQSGPPGQTVTYKSPFSADLPLGDKVAIDPSTGVISGIAPRSGLYIVTVTVKEYRNSIYIGEHRKEFQFTVESCVRQVVAAMPDKYNDCDGYTITFINNSTPNKEYVWDFGDGNTLTTTSRDPFQYTYAVQNTYTVKLSVDKNSSCGDSAFAKVLVYPILKPSFDASGLCITKPTQFINTSTNDIGNFEYYKWDFGDGAILNDTANVRTTSWQYTRPGDYIVSLYTRTDKGCEKTFKDTLSIYDKPPFTTTNDTMLCINDGLTLRAESTLPGSYLWGPTPLYNITGETTPTPYVTPKVDYAYNVTFTDNTGCTNTKEVKIDVRDKLLVRTGADSVICTGDPVNLQAVADGPYQFTWTDLGTRAILGNTPNITVTPARSSSYEIRVDLGSCFAADSINFRGVDPPNAFAGLDTTICYGEKLWLQASGGAYYSWTPPATLTNPRLPNTLAWPKTTTTYVVTVTDTLGCPKPVTASRMVTVIPPVPAFAGNDTIITRGQLFHMHGTGGYSYTWTPADGLTNPNIADPVTNINRDFTYHLVVRTIEGCVGEDDIKIRYMAGPEIYVPTAFTPNGDGVNDVFRPLPVGITKLESFRVYNRWGEEVYSTNEYMKGWDGTRRGQRIDSGTYVWIVRGMNEAGVMMERRGTVVLIR